MSDLANIERLLYRLLVAVDAYGIDLPPPNGVYEQLDPRQRDMTPLLRPTWQDGNQVAPTEREYMRAFRPSLFPVEEQRKWARRVLAKQREAHDADVAAGKQTVRELRGK